MSILESIGVAVFIMVVVFSVLAALCALIKLFSYTIAKFESMTQSPSKS